MIVTTNYVELKRRLRTSTIQTWIGGAMLLGSVLTFLVPSLVPELSKNGAGSQLIIILGYPLLIVGLIFFKRGQFNRRRYKGLGRIRPDIEIIENQLADLPPRYNLYNYVNFGGLAIDHLLVTPRGLLVILPKPHTGTISASHDKWKRKLGLFGYLTVFGEPALGDPSREVANLVKKGHTWFEQKEYALPTDGLITFTSPVRTTNPGALGVKLGPFDGMSFPVLSADELKAAVRGWDTDTRLTGEEQTALEKIIAAQMPDQGSISDVVRDVRVNGVSSVGTAAAPGKKGVPSALPVSRYALKQQRKEEKMRRLRYGTDPLGQPQKQVPYRKSAADSTPVASTAKGTRPNPETLERQRNRTKAPSRVTTVELPSPLTPTPTATTNPTALKGGKDEAAERRRK